MGRTIWVLRATPYWNYPPIFLRWSRESATDHEGIVTLRKCVFKAPAVALSLTLAGCGWSETHLSYGGKENGQPVFCVSSQPNCASPGAPLRSLQVDQIDESGRVLKTLWHVKAPPGWSSTGEVSKVIYGTAPEGWTVERPATGLTSGEHYSVNGQFYFSVTANGLILTEGKPVK